MRQSGAIVIAALLSCTSTVAEDQKSPVDNLIESAGLQNLTGPDREKLVSLITKVLTASAGSSNSDRMVAAMAKQYFTAKGYKLLPVQLAIVEGKNWIIVQDTFSNFATSDLPLMFPTMQFRNGYYFCKTGVGDGINEMIDGDGAEQSFMFAAWRRLR